MPQLILSTIPPDAVQERVLPRPGRGILVLLALAVAFAGLFTAGVLSLGHLMDLPVPCGGSRGCTAVAAHSASKVLGIPIAYGGVAAYLAIIAALVAGTEATCDSVPGPSHRARRARMGVLALAATGAAASAGLLLYSRAVIGATCPWCAASGLAMAALLVLAVALVRTKAPLGPVRPLPLWGLALVTSGALGVQAGWMQKSANAPPIPASRLAGLAPDDLVDPAKALGRPDAPVTIVMFGDLWCPACRSIHASLASFYRANPDVVRLSYRHLPLFNLRGHEFSGPAAALSEVAGEEGKFWQFLDAVSSRTQLDREGYLDLLERLGIETAGVEERIANPEDPAVTAVWRDIQLAEDLGVSATPTFIVIVDGRPPVSANQRTLPRYLNAPPVLARLAAARNGSRR